MPLTESSHIPRSTYRVQLQRKFTFRDLAELSRYLRLLGISDLYASPIFASTPGSTHGYDVTDYGTINPELGGSDGFDLLVTRLRSEGLDLILDFVPNHMGIAGMLNQWWRDVLENGRLSPYEPFFDIQWKEEDGRGHAWLLLPLLADHYGRMLEEGKISLTYSDEFAVHYGDISLPVSPRSYGPLLNALRKPDLLSKSGAALAVLVNEFNALRSGDLTADEISQHAETVTRLKKEMSAVITGDRELSTRLHALLEKINGVAGNPSSFDELHALIEKQHYRLAHWKAGTHEIDYRRFFAIDSLVGLHMEKPEVFRACHELLGRLVREGKVAGLRLDHIDGLRQPEDYLRRVQSIDRPDAAKPLYVLVEKILADNEDLPEAWPVHGTTGYEFIPQVAGVLVDASSRTKFDELYTRFTGESETLEEVIYGKKRLIIAEMFINAVSNLGTDLANLLSADRHWRDLTRHELTTAVSELMANLPVYRTYRRRQEAVSLPDRRVLEVSCARALARNPRADPQPFEFVRNLLIGTYPREDASAAFKAGLLSWVLTFQQYTGAVMAKAVEDTTFYTYNRLIALNEVGGDADYGDGSVDHFHQTNVNRLAHCPHAMLATSTHDTKFSEDVRARLYALSELSDDWGRWLADWEEIATRHTLAIGGGPAPDALDRYRFYQTLLGAWPLDDAEVNEVFSERLRGNFRKSVEEAKRHTSIVQTNEPYLAACERFVDLLLSPESGRDFMAAFIPRARHLARLGMINSLTQTVLKCTVPGVPDFYQGNEIWDFSLVDPDNRRQIDYGRRQRLLDTIAERSLSELLSNWRDGGIKLRVTQTLLQFRTQHPALFSSGAYKAITASGTFGENVLGFVRRDDDKAMLVLVPRLVAKTGTPPLGLVWDDTKLASIAATRGWRDLFTGRAFEAGEALLLRDLFSTLPFAVLESA